MIVDLKIAIPNDKEHDMRLQLALNVADLDDAIAFYSKMFATDPYKVKPGYANWEIANPPLKLVVFERPEAEHGSLNHLGVETESADQVVAAEERLRAAGLTTSGIDDTVCCFAEKVETWVEDGRGQRWEWYVKQADHDTQLENVIVEHDGALEVPAELATVPASAAGGCGSGDCC